MMMKFNYFMILKSSPWPMIMSINCFNMLFSIILLISGNKEIMLISMILLILSSLLWFMDLNTEYNLEGSSSLNLENTMKFFFILFILSEIMVFVSMFWSYYCFFLVKELEMMKWPMHFLKPFSWDLMPMLNTLLLISSSITLTISHWSMNTNKKKSMNMFLMITILLGITFTILQSKEYMNSYYSLNDGSFGSIFFMLTGLHGTHVIIGTMILIVCMIKSIKMSNFISNSESFEMGSWYWHFVDLVWIFVLYSLYYLN